LLVADSYEHDKAEDSETFFQTYNIELMSAATALTSIPIAVTKLIQMLEKHQRNRFAKSAAGLLTKYQNASIGILGKNIKFTKFLTAAAAIAGGLFFAAGLKGSMQSQLGLIRKASFDSTQNIINDPKMFAILTPEQEKQIEIISAADSRNIKVIDKIRDKTDIKSSFASVSDYKKNYAQYIKQKETYNQSLKYNPNLKLTEKQLQEARENQQLHENLLKRVELDPLERLRRIETISNVTYSSLFTGGFLEYLITDKLADVLHVKNKAIRAVMKFGVPLLTYLLLNKNISDIENKAILATKYKYLKAFIENPEEYTINNRTEKQHFPEFIKSVAKDIKDYETFANDELPEIQSKLNAKKSLKLTFEQEKTAKILQRNTAMALNEQRENVYEQSVGIKTFSETVLGPVDIAAAAIGGVLGSKLAAILLKQNPNNKAAGLCKGLGAVLTYIPAAILEAQLTKQQKLSEKTGTAMAITNLRDIKKFADYSNNFADLGFRNNVKVFEEFKNN